MLSLRHRSSPCTGSQWRECDLRRSGLVHTALHITDVLMTCDEKVAMINERLQLRRGMDLLRLDIVHAAYHIHHQRQAEGLPFIMAAEMLLVGR